MKKDYTKPFAEIIEFNSKDSIMSNGSVDVGGNVGAGDGSIGDFDWGM